MQTGQTSKMDLQDVDFTKVRINTSFNKFMDIVNSYIEHFDEVPFRLNGDEIEYKDNFKPTLLKHFKEDYISSIVKLKILEDAKNLAISRKKSAESNALQSK